MLNIQYILTPVKGPQHIAAVEMKSMWLTKKEAIAFFQGLAHALTLGNLCKVSMCVSNVGNVNQLPKWYVNGNGKLWADDFGVTI